VRWHCPCLPRLQLASPCSTPNHPSPPHPCSPFMWQDSRGHWHVLYHKMFDPPGQGPCGIWAGGHSFSPDGTAWSPIYRAYNTTLRTEDGGSLTVQRRERPKLIFNQRMQPTHLYNGVITGQPGSGTYTAVAPLNVA